MLIGICGSKCAGKSTVAQYLVEHHGFQRLRLSAPQDSNGTVSSSELTEESSPSDPAEQIPAPSKPSPPAHSFTSATDLLDFVTKYWRSRWVTTDIHDEAVLDILSRRPFFILVSVDAPIVIRWRRYQARSSSSSSSCAGSSSSPPSSLCASLEEFIAESDDHLYSGSSGVLPLISRATVRLLNTSSSLAHLYATLGKLDLTNPERLRPSWDNYFMSLASLAAQRSNCMKRAVGCVLVGRERRVISTGYNGTPRGIRNCGEGGCARCNAGMGSGAALATCLCLHAEENALLEAGRERIRDGSVLYCNTCPCLTCSIKIVQVGISEVVYSQGYSMDGETAEVFKSAGVKLRQFSPPANGLIHLEKMDLY
ncbi:cytidine and deoxycytidylate deaminase zinc-binding domain-containing protein [Apiospora kogelbergensis]|uniref:cytidine and deoxycytidylate deaminase zinc-binding domain-containing protein n=1 Tax=Apiospora kogelbergensis TaxID=1337665 RepID=UPI0031311F80